MPYTLPDLPYGYDALEPAIDEATMRVHHDKHHRGYTDKLNAALATYPEYEGVPIDQVLARPGEIPGEIRMAVVNNGGGYHNHALFWTSMIPDGGGVPSGELAAAIARDLGSFDSFRRAFESAATGQFGSGWAWLVHDQNGLHVEATANQDSPLADGQTPLLGLDVWEHAYYLQYQNRRADYVAAWWDVVDWDEIERRFAGVSAQTEVSR